MFSSENAPNSRSFSSSYASVRTSALFSPHPHPPNSHLRAEGRWGGCPSAGSGGPRSLSSRLGLVCGRAQCGCLREAHDTAFGFGKPRWSAASLPHDPCCIFTSNGPLTRPKSPCQPLDKQIKCCPCEMTFEAGQVLNDTSLIDRSFSEGT